MSKNFFSNSKCEYFPCHKLPEGKDFNCMFCYCPLYLLGKDCGGDFEYSKKGVKNCKNCSIPHVPENYDLIINKLREHIKKNSNS